MSKNALADAREEMLDHDSMIELESVHPQHLPISRFKRKMDVSDNGWSASLPQIAIELRKGHRDMLKQVLEAAERLDVYSFDGAAQILPPASSAQIGTAIEDFMAEHSAQWSVEMTNKVRAYLSILLEYFGAERCMNEITRLDAAELKKVVQGATCQSQDQAADAGPSLARSD